MFLDLDSSLAIDKKYQIIGKKTDTFGIFDELAILLFFSITFNSNNIKRIIKVICILKDKNLIVLE